MENEKMVAVLTELLEEQKEISSSQKEIIDVLHRTKIQLEGIAAGIQSQKTDVGLVDLKPIQQSIEKGITEIRLSIHSQLQKQHSNNWRIFLESDAKKWAVILVVALAFLTYLYCYLVHKS